jgi:NitT/TauT family transport system permease protein
MTIQQKLGPTLLVVCLFLGWQSLSHWQIVSELIVPSPESVAQVLFQDFKTLMGAAGQTLMNSLKGLLIALLFVAPSSLLISRSQTLQKMFLPLAQFFQIIPLVAIAPLLVIWFGFGDPTVIASASIVSFFPLFANFLAGFSRRDQLLEDVFTVYAVPGWKKFFLLQLPLAAPFMMAGLKIGVGLCLVGAIVGEFIAGGGLGSLIDSARTQQRVDLVFAALIMTAMMGWLLLRFLSLGEAYLQSKRLL